MKDNVCNSIGKYELIDNNSIIHTEIEESKVKAKDNSKTANADKVKITQNNWTKEDIALLIANTKPSTSSDASKSMLFIDNQQPSTLKSNHQPSETADVSSL